MNNTEESGPISIPAGVACGKAILLGEHAVVYGIPAIAVGIEHGVRADARPLERGPSRLAVREWNVEVEASANDPDLQERSPSSWRRADATRRC